MFASLAGELLARGGDRVAIHLRGPGVSARRLWALGVELQASCRRTGAVLLVNDRVDLAMGLGVAGTGPRVPVGVHLGARSLPPPVARDLLGPGPLLGRSVHQEAEALALLRPPRDRGEGTRPADLDYLMVGTLFATASHPGRRGVGQVLPVRLGERTSVPLVGVGGITPERAGGLRVAGLHGVAVIRGIWDAADPAAALDAYLGALDSPPDPSGGNRAATEQDGGT